MKCPMCGSNAVYAYPVVEHMHNSITGKWDATMMSGDVVGETQAICGCGWVGEVNQLEADK